MRDSVGLLFTILCNYHPRLILEYFCHLTKKPCTFQFHSPPAPGNHYLATCCLDGFVYSGHFV